MSDVPCMYCGPDNECSCDEPEFLAPVKVVSKEELMKDYPTPSQPAREWLEFYIYQAPTRFLDKHGNKTPGLSVYEKRKPIAESREFHVIEYSAYEQMRKELSERILEKQLELSNVNGLLAKQTKERDRLREIVDNLPKVPTEPYEKQMAKEIVRLRAALEEIANDSDHSPAFNEERARKALE